MSEQNPLKYQVMGVLSGFSALYGIFAIGCLVILVLVLLLLPDTYLKDVLAILAIVGFFSFAIYACILRRKHPEAFATKQEIKIVVEQYLAKGPEEKQPKIVVSKPTPEKPREIKKLKP